VAQLQIDEALMQDDYKVPPLVIQPYVENAILHGLLKKKYGVGKLQIQVRKKDDRLLYIIEDNGIGRQVSAPYPPREIQSYGLQLSSERIRLFNKETESAVSITDLKENGQACGTRVEVYLKIQ
jgi:LytS/YehU family sensor histidine kinase